MKKYLVPVLSAALLSAVSFASPQPLSGEVTVAHGWVRQADGTKLDVTGMTFPYKAVPIRNAKKLQTGFKQFEFNQLNGQNLFNQRRGKNGQNTFGNKGFQFQGVSGDNADTAVYDTNYGVYGYIENNPSSLDDITLSGTAVNKPWTTLGFGFHYGFSNFSNFLIRWRVWKTNVDNAAPANDFTSEIADFGVIWDQSVTQGAWFVTIDISQAGVVTDDTSLFMAQQFREVQLDGEGAFINGIDTVFNFTNNPPSVGSSENQFWYDWDPLDGAYENTEIDQIEGSRADHAWTITVNSDGIVNTLNPNLTQVATGFYNQGTFDSLHFAADGDVYSMFPTFAGSRESPIAALEIQANCPTATPLSMKFDMIAYSSVSDMQVSVDFFNYVTNTWIQVFQTVVGTTPQEVSGTYGGVLPLDWFVSNSTPRKVRARVRFKNLSPALPRDPLMQIDKFVWQIVR